MGSSFDPHGHAFILPCQSQPLRTAGRNRPGKACMLVHTIHAFALMMENEALATGQGGCGLRESTAHLMQACGQNCRHQCSPAVQLLGWSMGEHRAVQAIRLLPAGVTPLMCYHPAGSGL